jgi:hypothetical protein
MIRRWSVPIATIGSSIAVAETLLHYARAHAVHASGGYAPWLVGSAAVGLLTGWCSYVSQPTPDRSAIVSAATGAVALLAVAGAMFAVMVWAFGS